MFCFYTFLACGLNIKQHMRMIYDDAKYMLSKINIKRIIKKKKKKFTKMFFRKDNDMEKFS